MRDTMHTQHKAQGHEEGYDSYIAHCHGSLNALSAELAG